MSASKIPAVLPVLARATARFAATVDFPTPPFPAITAIIFFTPDKGPSPLSFSDIGLTSIFISSPIFP